MGYEKDFLVIELDTQKKNQDREIENMNELADMTSLSSEGLIAKVVAFFGGGATSLLVLSKGLFQSEDSASKLTNGTLSAVVTKINNLTITNQNTTELSGQVPSTSPALPNEVIYFLIAGGISFFLFILIMKLIKGWRIKRILNRTIEEQQKHWEKHVRPEFIRLMMEFFYDIKEITRENFRQYREDILGYSDRLVTEYISDLIPRENLYIHNAEEQLKDLKIIRDWSAK